jgi:glucose-1-phosphate thymidylyltransferase
VRAKANSNRLVGVLSKGIIVVAPATRADGPWLYATRATSLQPVANRPIVCHVLDALAAAGVVEVAVISPPNLSEEIARCISSEGPSHVEVSQLIHDRRNQPDEAIRAATEFAGGAPVILHRADGLLGQPLGPLLEVLREDQSDMVLLIAQGSRHAEPLGVATRKLVSVVELNPSNAAHAMAGVCLLGPGVLGRLDREPLLSQGVELTDLAERLVARDCSRVHVRVVREWRRFAGDALDLLDMNRAVLDALDERMPLPQDGGNRFEGAVFIDATASVTSSVICGPVIVGPGAYVADSYIGPHTSIGQGVHIEGAEIERSIILAGASILHVGGRLVASVVGRDARIFRDFSMPRAMRLQVGDGDEVALC